MSAGKRGIFDPDSLVSVDVDPVSKGLVVMDEMHRLTHRGLLFTASHYEASVSNGADLSVVFLTAVGQSVHARFEAECGGNARVRLYENVNTSDDGTALDAVCRRRTSAGTVKSAVSYGPTVVDYGELLYDGYVNGGTGGNAVGGHGDTFSEWILAQNAKYLLRITNVSGQAKAFGVDINFYEPDL